MTPPPIASPHVYETRTPSKPPFRGLKNFVKADVVSLLVSPLASVYSPPAHRLWVVGFSGVFFVLWGLLLWRLWHGSGVARAIFWWANALSMVFAAFKGTGHENLPTWLRWVYHVDHAFLLFGLVWLQLPGVKAHFRRDKAA